MALAIVFRDIGAVLVPIDSGTHFVDYLDMDKSRFA
jgi:hypothetical protein